MKNESAVLENDELYIDTEYVENCIREFVNPEHEVASRN